MWLPPSPDVLPADVVPYFNWDGPVTNGDIRRALADGPEADRLYWMARVMREARYDDVWTYVGMDDVAARIDALLPLLGRRAPFWRFLISTWRRLGVLPPG